MRGNFITDRRGKLNPNYKDGRTGTEPVETKFRRKVGGMEDGCV